MKEQYLGRDVHMLILGEKLNGFKSAHSDLERQRIIKNAIDWVEANPNATLNLY
jgi:hypothetical protein